MTTSLSGGRRGSPHLARTAEHLAHRRRLVRQREAFELLGRWSNRTMALAPKTLSHTWSRSSTYTEYACGPAPGSFHSRHDPPDPAAGS